MPRDIDTTTVPSDLFSKIAGATGAKTYKAKRGAEMLTQTRGFNLLVFGKFGSGKTFIIVDMLRLGMKVLVINTDFGKNGLNTVYNYFADHPDEAHFLNNLVSYDLDLDGFMKFCRNPESIVPDILEFDPDVIFWDGATAFQQADLEGAICGGDFMREDTTYADWRKTRNGTVFPLMKLLEQHNPNGKQWSKVVTTLEQEKGKYKKGATNEEKKKGLDYIAGSEQTGPMLHTEARDLAGAGFDLVLQTFKQNFGDKDKFLYQSRGADLLVKDRGFGLPTKMDANFKDIFEKYIGPKIGWRAKSESSAR